MTTRRKITVAAVLAVLFFVNGVVLGTTYYVDPNGDDDANGLFWATAFATIQKGIDTAADFNVVEVNEGTYYEYNVDFNGVSCTLRSTDPNDWDVVEATIIDAETRDIAIRFENGEDANTILSGFTINRGDSKNIYCYGTSPVIKNCIIKNGGSMGILYEGSASPTIINNKIRDNSTIGISCESSSPAIIKNNWIYSNYTGISLYSSSPIIRNNTIVGNTNCGIYRWGTSNPTISNCIIWDHNDNDLDGTLSTTYSCIQDCNDANGVGNICGDANNPSFVDADSNDFHLDSNSPCINVGDTGPDYSDESDIDGDAREQGGRIDMGADETAYRVYNIDKEKWYTTIQSAINDSNYGDEIEVTQGTYQGSIEMIGHTCELRSTDPCDRDVVEATIIAGQAEFYENDCNASLAGFTVRGIVCNEYSEPTIKNCIIKNNMDNGVTISGSSPKVINCEIYGNNYGFNIESGSPTIRNNTIVNNTSYGIYSSGGSPVISNCIIWGHDSNDLDPNFSATYSCIQDPNDANGTGNISGDANDPNFIDDANDDYHLNGASPCINAGDPNGSYSGEKDIDGDLRLLGAYVDIGADETAGIWYVDIDAASGGDGSCWAKAYDDLQDGLGAASSGDEIWVAEGTYYPDENDPNNRNLSFELVADVNVYGGFDGTETARSQRDWTNNETILSGNIDTSGTDDSYHVVKGADGATLDGFTVQYGNANGSSNNGKGGGLYFWANNYESFTVRNCHFKNNKGTGLGGGISIEQGTGSWALVENCSFTSCQAKQGGALWVENIKVDIVSCKFEYNRATIGSSSIQHGGAIYLSDNGPKKVESCVFKGNVADYDGGAIYLENYNDTSEITNCAFYDNHAPYGGGGAIKFTSPGAADANIINCVFASNYANRGGALDVYNTGEDQKVSIINNTFYNNSARGDGCMGAALYFDGNADQYVCLDIYNNIFWDDVITEGYADQECDNNMLHKTVVPHYNNFRSDTYNNANYHNTYVEPNFVDTTDLDGNDNQWMTSDDGLALDPNDLDPNSPCIDAADSNDTPTTDILGNNRYDDPNTTDTGAGDPNYYDMGAYEYQG